MSYYEDERRQRRPTRDRARRDSYDEETAYNTRDNQRGGGALVKRRDSFESIEEVSRDFSPGRGGYTRETTIRKSGTRPARPRSFEDDRYDYDDRSYASGRRSKYSEDRRDRRSRRYSSEYSSRSRSRTPPRKHDKERRKSKGEEALAALGLGGLAATLLGKKERSRSRSRSRDRSRDRSRSRGRAYSDDGHSTRRRSKSRGGMSRDQLTQALKAAVLAGAGEAFRARKEPGGWTGEKGKRILTAAAAAGGVDGFVSHGKGEDEHKTRNTLGSAIAGIATSRIVNGPRSKSRGGRAGSPDSKRERSQSRGGLGDLAAGGVLAATAKKVYDSVNGRSESRGRPRSRSRSSERSRSASRTSRRRSLSRGVAKGLAAVGLKGAADKVDPERRRSERYAEDNVGRSPHGYDDRDRDSYYRDDVGQPRSGPPIDQEHAHGVHGVPSNGGHSRTGWDLERRVDSPSYSLDYGPRHYGDPDTDSDSDLGSSSGEEKEHKKSRKKALLTSGLAAVATIHAGHSVYQSVEKRHARKKALKEGKITPAQAKANRNRDRLQDAASVGLAAIALKGTYNEINEMREARKEFIEGKEKVVRHKAKRAARREKYASFQNEALSPPPSGHSGNRSMPDLHAPQPIHPPEMSYEDEGRYGHSATSTPFYDGHGPYNAAQMPSGGPQYFDANPYAAQAARSPGQMPGPPLPPPGPPYMAAPYAPSPPVAHRAREGAGHRMISDPGVNHHHSAASPNLQPHGQDNTGHARGPSPRGISPQPSR